MWWHQSNLKRATFSLITGVFLFISIPLKAQITLSHNVGSTLVETDMYSCDADEIWARIFELSEFGITENEQFIIRSGEVAFSKLNSGAALFFSIYSIDDDIFPFYPYSQSPPTLLGTRGVGETPVIDGAPEIVSVEFDVPIVVPASTKKILVTVYKSDSIYEEESSEFSIAGTENDNDESWYLGCDIAYNYTRTTELSPPVENANFFINVTGEVYDIYQTNPFIRLTHNVGDEVLDSNMYSCSSSYVYWGRTFYLEDFGIAANEKFEISSGQVAIYNVAWLPEIQFNIYKIDENFPDSFCEAELIGSSQYSTLSTLIDDHSQIWQIDFEDSVIIPAGVERILVEVHKGIINDSDATAFIGRTAEDTDESWQRGCATEYEYKSTTELDNPDANFYINVTGKTIPTGSAFTMKITNSCVEFLKEFGIVNPANIDSIVWDFGDPASGSSNISTDLSPTHDFTEDGPYTVTATITTIDGIVEFISETILVREPPTAYAIDNLEACEITPNSGIANFDLSDIALEVIGDQLDKTVTFVDGLGNEYGSLPSPYTNSIPNFETITIRVAHTDLTCCFSETSFDLIVHPLPLTETISDLYACESQEGNGFADFDLLTIKNSIIGNASNIEVTFLHENGQIILEPLDTVNNIEPNQETITARIADLNTGCSNETDFQLIVNAPPVMLTLPDLVACDDDNDGISSYFDTSMVETTILNGQTSVEVSYFDALGNLLPSPLPNPLTNSVPFSETITVRLTDTTTQCYSETSFQLQTVTEPSISSPEDLVACDLGNGFAQFDTSEIEFQLIGNQTGLEIYYFDNNNNPLPSPLPQMFENTEPNFQTIYVRVEDTSNPICYTETEFNLIVNEAPIINLEDQYVICNLEPSLSLSLSPEYDMYLWVYENGTTISTSNSVEIFDEGTYSVTVGKNENGITCQSTFSFQLSRSILPQIQEVNYGELGDNFIEIIASGDGDFEYSIDGMQFQDSNYFSNISGGTFNVIVRDKGGCGSDTEQVTIIDYPKFFTPNNDGDNDYWEIKGVEIFPDFEVSIYDRYGRLLARLNPSNPSWNGEYNGDMLRSDDYWFQANLGNNTSFKGHFSLRR